jgi:MFS family permease
MQSTGFRRAVFTCMLLFYAQPLQLGVWLARIAEIQTSLDLTKSELSLALIGMPFGLLPTLYFAGQIIDRIGPRRSFLWAFPLMCFAGIAPSIAINQTMLFFALMSLGAVFAFTEVGLNVFAAKIEKVFQVQIMNRAHGFWSLGVMTGSLISVQLAGLNMTAQQALTLSGLLAVCILVIGSWAAPDLSTDPNTSLSSSMSGIPTSIFPIIAVVFGATLAEGAMNDWATVYMNEAPWGGGPNDGLAVTSFVAMVTLARFSGDWCARQFGVVVLARTGLCLSILGVLILINATSMLMALTGFALVGLGVATIFPLAISATARLSTQHQARNVSIMTFGALLGFLVGPPIIGFASDVLGLKTALSVIIPVLVISIFYASRLK